VTRGQDFVTAPRRYAQFTLGRRIGEGGMGVVWEAFDDRRRRVALKTLREVDAHSLYLFKNEFRELADLRHPNLVELGELVCAEGQWFFTMELIDGVDLLRWVRRGAPTRAEPDGALDGTLAPGAIVPSAVSAAPLPPPQWPEHSSGGLPAYGARARPEFDEPRVRDAFGQLAAALVALHAAGKIHRDIKPSNIMVDDAGRAGRVVLLDFGLVTHMRGDEGGGVVGTPAYMAPEQAASLPVGPAADLYGVGAVLFEALTGRLPFVGKPLEVLVAKQRGVPPRPGELVEDVPPDLDCLCADLLATDPAARPSATEVLARLGGVARTAPAPAGVAAPVAPFVGRDGERAALAGALAESRRGGVAMLVAGESGVGKSSLLRHFVDDAVAAEPRSIALWGRCYERESVPFQAFDRVVDALSQALVRLGDDAPVPPHASALIRLFPVLRRVPGLAAAASAPVTGSPRSQRAAGFAALRALLAALGEARPVIVVIDDLQWADGDSWDLLAEVLRAPAPQVLLLASGREVAPPAGVEVMDEFRTLALGTLPPDDARRLADLLGVPGADRIVAETGGHPMFLHEIARSPGGIGGRRAGLDAVLGRRTAALEREARVLLEVLAIAGRPISLDVAAAAAELDDAAIARVVPVLRAAHLARGGGRRADDRIETYHDRVRAAVLARLGERTRRAHHGALARALEARGGADPQVLVSHLEHAGDAAGAAYHAERGARAAADSLAFELAANLYATVLRLGAHTEDRRRELERARADALANAGRGAEAAAAYLAAADGLDATDGLDCRRRAAEYLLGSGHIARGLEVLREVLVEFGETLPATSRAALARLLWSRARLRAGGLRWRERDPGAIPPRELVRLDAFKAVAVCLGPIDLIRGAEFQARLLRAALKVGERRQVGRALAIESIYLATAGHASERRALAVLARARAIADATGDRYLRAYVLAAEGMVAHSCGHFMAAAEHLRVAEEVQRDVVEITPWEVDIVRLFRLISLRLAGRLGELRAPLEEYLREARHRGDRFVETSMTAGMNAAWLAADEPDQAIAALDAQAWQPLPGSYHTQHFFMLFARGEHALYTGDATRALERLAPDFAALGGSFLARLENVKTQTWHLRGRLLLAAGQLDEAAACARRLHGIGLDYAHVWARSLEAAIAAGRGDLDTARTHLAEAADLGDGAADQPLVAACCRRRLAALVGGTAGDELEAAADAALTALGIASPVRMTDAFIPWHELRA
jgi:hypothetical protein